jgi:hypothetical protein
MRKKTRRHERTPITAARPVAYGEEWAIGEKEALFTKLKALNPYYSRAYGITQADVDEVDRCIKAIRRSRSRRRPKSGDVLATTDRFGEYSPCRRINGKGRWLGRNIAYCADACGVKDVCVHIDKAGVVTHSVAKADKRTIWGMFTYTGKRTVRLYVWGHDKLGLIAFDIVVNAWEHKALFPLYGRYNTRDFAKFNVYKLTDRRGQPLRGNKYRYFARSSAFMRPFTFKTGAQYEQWLKECDGTEFAGKYPKHKVVFCDIERTLQYLRRYG